MLIERPIDRDSQKKLYVQIYSIIREKIEKGEWKSGMQIPTEDELCTAYGVSKATVRMAISELAIEGYLKRQQGKGTFVTYARPYIGLSVKTRLTENMFKEGVKVKKEILEKGLRKPLKDISALLGSIDENIYYIRCKRIVNGEPAYIEESYIPLSVFPDIEGEDVCRYSLYDLIQEKAVNKIYKVIQTIEVTEITGDAAGILDVKDRSPGLLLHRLLVNSDGATIAYTRFFGSGRKYKIQTEFERIR